MSQVSANRNFINNNATLKTLLAATNNRLSTECPVRTIQNYESEFPYYVGSFMKSLPHDPRNRTFDIHQFVRS